MGQTIFAFGQRGGYYLECPSLRKYGNLPDAFGRLLDVDLINTVYCAVLGADASYAVSYEDRDGSPQIQSSGLPPALESWLREKDEDGLLVRKLEHLQVALGPYNTSYFATDGDSLISLGIPAGLKSAIDILQKPGGGFKIAPKLVVLGVGNDYAMLTHEATGSWELSNYKELAAGMEQIRSAKDGLSLITDISLNAHRMQSYILHLGTGAMLFRNLFDVAEDDIKTIAESVKLEARENEQQNSQWSLANHLPGVNNMASIVTAMGVLYMAKGRAARS